jgi:hypothetical protein
MKKLLVLILALSLGIGTIFVVGCSDDDDDNTGTGPGTLPTGDPTDPVFVTAMDPFMDASDMIPWGLEPLIMGMMHLVDSMSMAKSDINQPDTLWYNEDNQYWYGEATGFDGDFGMNYHSYDSMQFMHGAVAAKWPDTATLTQINGGGFRLYTIITADKEMAGDTGVYYSFVGNVTGAPGALGNFGDITANGSGHIYFLNQYYYADPLITCFAEIYDDFLATDVLINIYNMMFMGVCPDGGKIEHDAWIGASCSGDTTISNIGYWSVTETYATDTVHYVVENSEYRWQFSEECFVPR